MESAGKSVRILHNPTCEALDLRSFPYAFARLDVETGHDGTNSIDGESVCQGRCDRSEVLTKRSPFKQKDIVIVRSGQDSLYKRFYIEAVLKLFPRRAARKLRQRTRQLDFLTTLSSSAGEGPPECDRLFFIRFECRRQHLTHFLQFISEILPRNLDEWSDHDSLNSPNIVRSVDRNKS
jgi:hypothetical protein